MNASVVEDHERTASHLLATAGRDELDRASRAISGVVRTTPLIELEALSEDLGAPIVAKAECLQRTGAFKLRGAVAKVAEVAALGTEGVVAASAGNHAQGVALAAASAGIPAQIFMPARAPESKVDAVRRLGGEVRLHGDTFDDALAMALTEADRHRTFVHPFDDPAVIGGQGTVGLELLGQARDVRSIVVPVGGGGLAAGIGLALRRASPRARLVGVQTAAYPSMAQALFPDRSRPSPSHRTLADGIAVRTPGALTRHLLGELLDDLVVVDDNEIAQAMAYLAETANLIAEGAGAVSLAAVLAGHVDLPGDGTTAVIVSGGNVDRSVLLRVMGRADTVAGRRLSLLTRIDDRPGGLSGLVTLLAERDVNIVDVQHSWNRRGLDIRETAVQLLLEVRNADHADEVLAMLAGAEYAVQVLE